MCLNSNSYMVLLQSSIVNIELLVHLVLYADDMNLFYNHKSLAQAVNVMNNELFLLQQWLLANKLTINISKTKFISFSSKQKRKFIDHQCLLKIMNQSITKTHEIKFLGIIIDEHLTWDVHIDFLSRKIAKSIGILYKVRHFLNTDILKSLYYSLLYSYISYSTFVWGSNYKTKLKRIHILQKRALRVINFADRKAPSRPLFQRLDILNIFEIVKLQLGELVFNYLNGCLPSAFKSYFTDLSDIHNYNTRSKSNKNLYLPKIKLNYGKFGVKYAAAKIWNEIPLRIKQHQSLKNFRDAYKQHLISE